jgi:O-antigen/teichoic acid export membrane protein
MDAPIWAYLLAWVVAQVIGGVTLTYLGWREAYRRAWLADFNFSLKELRHHHDGLLRFAILSNLYMALQIIIAQMSTFLVGFLAGPSAAGIFKIGREASTVLSKPAELLNQSIYPEFARLGSTGHWHAFTRLILRGGAVAAGVGVFMLALVIAFGSPALETFFGEAFGAAYIPLILMVAAATLAIIGFPMDAALFAMGHAGLPLRVSAGVTLLIHLPLLFFLGRLYGPVGAALAIFAASAATLAIMTTLTAIYLRRHTTQTDGPRPILEPHKFV